MSDERLLTFYDSDPKRLEIRLALLELELTEVQQATSAFEQVLRTQLSDLIIEAQELYVLYKAIKKAKKAKRIEQKKRGKNYKEPTGIVRSPKKKESDLSPEDQKEKKRLYREAMLHVHPDKFSMNDTDAETATEVTTRLIEIYRTESLEVLRAYHAHIFSGNTGIRLSESASEVQALLQVKRAVPTSVWRPGAKAQMSRPVPSSYLLLEIESLKALLVIAKENQLYKVKTEYTNPLSFIDELKGYYQDRISKLRKRTRKGL